MTIAGVVGTRLEIINMFSIIKSLDSRLIDYISEYMVSWLHSHDSQV
jgi:hypothetical protein